MAGAELIGKEELKEIEVLFKTGSFARYCLDKERQGIWKVRDFEKAFTGIPFEIEARSYEESQK